ncbi:MAG: Intein-containing protein [Parcubacteria group bacterium GW2011_GWF1_45_5]|nr:MAG: Intein-containing protein [Parcubacteria group bacterium GW2011_GWF1_45_5]
MKARGAKKVKKYSHLTFGDVRFYHYLLGIGFVQRKSTQLGILKINMSYFADFLRGVIDGDGSISTWIHKSNQHRQWSLRITSAAPTFISWLRVEIEQYFNVRGKLYHYSYTYKKNPIYILKFGKIATQQIIGQTYYKDATGLSRKIQLKTECLRDGKKMVNYGGVLCPGAGTGRQP